MAGPLIFTRLNGSPTHWRLRIEEARSILRPRREGRGPSADQNRDMGVASEEKSGLEA